MTGLLLGSLLVAWVLLGHYATKRGAPWWTGLPFALIVGVLAGVLVSSVGWGALVGVLMVLGWLAAWAGAQTKP